MSNPNSPNGLIPLSGSVLETVPMIASATIARGDLLALVAGKVLPYVEGTHAAACGVALNAGVADDTVAVACNPDQLFSIQCDDAWSQAIFGSAVDIQGATGVQKANAVTVVNGTLQIFGLAAGSTLGAYNRVLTRIAQHAFTRMNRTVGLMRANAPITMSGNPTLTPAMAEFLPVDPDGSNREITLPDWDLCLGRQQIIKHVGGANTVAVKDQDGTTIATLTTGTWAAFFCAGGAWYSTGVVAFT